MTYINKLQGMRFPTESVIRMFFKERLYSFTNKKILEFGCGSGNHLMLFGEYGWQVSGIDYDPISLKMARHNLQIIDKVGKLYLHDLNYELPVLEDTYDAFLMPSCLYYIQKEAAIARLREVSKSLNQGCIVFCQMRLPDDHRYARGIPAGKDSWYLNIDYTGEKGLLNAFWSEYELIGLLNKTLGVPIDSMIKLKMSYENCQNGINVRNSDIVLWGRKT